MKLDKELYTQHAKRLAAILNDKSSFVPYLTKTDFVKVIENSLNTLSAVEKILTKVELAAQYSSKALAKEFNNLGKNSFAIDEKFKYDDETDLIDNINYLHMYCKNIFKVDLDDLVQGKEVKASSPQVSLGSKTDVEEAGPSAAAMGMGMGAMGAMGAYQNPFIMGQAYNRVKEDMATGKLYTYSSKPKSIITAKILAAVTLCLAILTLFIGAIFAFMAKGYLAEMTVYDSTGKIIQEYRPLNWYSIGPGIMYLLIGGFGIYPLYQIINGLKSKNDNIKYYFTWPWILIFILMALLFVMPDMKITWFIKSGYAHEQTALAKTAFEGWKVMYIIALSAVGLCLVPMIIGAVNNPKQDKALIEKLLQQYADEIINPFKGSTPSDVQKPVDVKKPENEAAKDSDSNSKK